MREARTAPKMGVKSRNAKRMNEEETNDAG